MASKLTKRQYLRLAPGLRDTIERAVVEERQAQACSSLRSFAESTEFCNLGHELTPLMCALMAAIDGHTPTTIDDATCVEHFGCKLAELPTQRQRLIVVRTGARAGKSSHLLATAAVLAAITTPLPTSLAPGEVVYVSIVAPLIKTARHTFQFIKGIVAMSPVLNAMVIGEPTSEVLALRRPDGGVVNIAVLVAGRAGLQLRSRTHLSVFFDEAAFFRDEATGVVNDEELYRSVVGRTAPGGQIWFATTPQLKGVGLVEEHIERDFGKHTHALCFVSGTRALNPTWDPDGRIEAEMRATDPDNAAREIDGIPLANGAGVFFNGEAIKQAIGSVNPFRPVQLAPEVGAVYAAGADAGFRKNSSALVIIQLSQPVLRTVLVNELKPAPGMPLKPAAVIDEFADDMRTYGCGHLVVDSHERDEVQTELARNGCSAVSAPNKEESYILARKLLHEGQIELPNHPVLIRQLRDVISRPKAGGGIFLSSPQTADGRHGDVASAWVCAVWRAYTQLAAAPVPRQGRAIAMRRSEHADDILPPAPAAVPRHEQASRRPTPAPKHPTAPAQPPRPRTVVPPYRPKF